MTEAERITRALGGRWYGSYGAAACPAHEDRHPSLTLSDASSGRLLAHCKSGCSFAAVLGALRGLGLVQGRGTSWPPGPAELERHLTAEKAVATKREAQARAIWAEAVPVAGTLAETYLRGRRITCDLPESLRFHPACWHPSAKRLPALVARVDGASRFALHRTFLRADGAGKAEVEPAKAMLGRVAGGHVTVTEATGPLVVAEGLETALSLASGLLRVPATVWAALSAPGMAALTLPLTRGHLTIAMDGDAAGRGAGHKLAERAIGLGWSVRLMPAPDGRDWNDVLAEDAGVR